MANLILNYAHAPKVNYLYIMNNDFIGFVEKLSKQEKEILKAKLIWKRKNKKEEPKQETLNYTEAAKKEERIFNSTMMYKQETLEEAGIIAAGMCEHLDAREQAFFIAGFIESAKWQQEQDKKCFHPLPYRLAKSDVNYECTLCGKFI